MGDFDCCDPSSKTHADITAEQDGQNPSNDSCAVASGRDEGGEMTNEELIAEARSLAGQYGDPDAKVPRTLIALADALESTTLVLSEEHERAERFAGERDNAFERLEALLPKEVQRVEELDALPSLTVLRGSDGAVFEHDAGAWWQVGENEAVTPETVWFPARVLFLPEPAPAEGKTS